MLGLRRVCTRAQQHMRGAYLAPVSRPSSTSAPASSDGGAPSSSADLKPKYRYFIPDDVIGGAPEIVRRAMSLDTANAMEIKQAEKMGYVRMLGLRPGDTGSTAVQVSVPHLGEAVSMSEMKELVFTVSMAVLDVAVACLTVRIKAAEEHCAKNRQDKVSKRGYVGLMTRRRKLLAYLRRTDFPGYKNVIEVLGLKGFA